MHECVEMRRVTKPIQEEGDNYGRSWSIQLHDKPTLWGGEYCAQIRFCPFCGMKLWKRKSKRVIKNIQGVSENVLTHDQDTTEEIPPEIVEVVVEHRKPRHTDPCQEAIIEEDIDEDDDENWA